MIVLLPLCCFAFSIAVFASAFAEPHISFDKKCWGGRYASACNIMYRDPEAQTVLVIAPTYCVAAPVLLWPAPAGISWHHAGGRQGASACGANGVRSGAKSAAQSHSTGIFCAQRENVPFRALASLKISS